MLTNKNIILSILFFIIFNNMNLNQTTNISGNPIFMTAILSLIVYMLDKSNKTEKFLEKFTVPNNINTINNTKNINQLKNQFNVNNKDLEVYIDPNNKLGYPSVKQIVKETIKSNNKTDCNCDDMAQKSIYNFLKERRIVDKKGLLHYADDYFADLGYSDIRYENYISPKSGGAGVYNSLDMGGYNIINSDRWAPPARLPTSCKNNDVTNVSPIATVGYPLNLQEFDQSRRILPKDNINIDYIKDRLNK